MPTINASENAEQSVESVTARISRLSLTDISEARLESLTIAHLRVEDATFTRLSNALRVNRGTTIILPAHRYEGLSRGKGWCRRGRGDSASWGERVEGGYRVEPGRWTVGGSDGFSRKGQDEWTVEHVQVGDEVWTVAN